jgi:hypothetical protein
MKKNSIGCHCPWWLGLFYRKARVKDLLRHTGPGRQWQWRQEYMSAKSLKHDIFVKFHFIIWLFLNFACSIRDGNSGTGTRPDGYGDDFLPVGGTRTRSESRRIQDGYFFSPTSTRYFTTAIILGCKQVKICLFRYINYDLFWLLNFATLLFQIFVEY